MITHAHNDHTSDLESILTLLNNSNKRRKGLDDFTSDDTIRADIAKSREMDISKVSEEDIEKAFLEGSSRRKVIDFYISKSVDKKFSGMLNLYSNDDYTYHVIERGDVKILFNGSLKVNVIGAKHNDIISDRESVGFVFIFDKLGLIYTGDTGWSAEIEKQYESISEDLKDKHIVLLAHMGGFKEYENKYLFPETRKDAFYKNHLGRLGLAKLVQIIKPEICFISEFGEEMRNYREELAEIYTRIFKQTTLFIPADIGLEYHLNNDKIRAITELDLDKYEYKTSLIDPNCIRTCLLRKDYSLHYFDDHATFKESALIQVLIEQFDKSSF